MKKNLILLLAGILTISPAFAQTDKTSEDYLKNKKHFAIMNPSAEFVAQRIIKKSLKKETAGKYKVSFDGYTLHSMKQGVFKNLKITGKDLTIEKMEVPYMSLKTLSDYNRIDYTQKPPVVKTDMVMAYEVDLSEKTINQALDHKEYKKTLEKVNKYAYPLFVLNNVDVKLRNDKVYIIMEYNFPIAPSKKNKTFMVATTLKALNGKVETKDIEIDSAYGNLSNSKVRNLIDLLNPLSFTLDLMNTQKCKGKIENVKIVDNIIKINGKIYVKGE